MSDHHHHHHMGYNYKRVGAVGAPMMQMKRYSCGHGLRGFKVNPRRFSVQRLRSKFFFLLKIFNRWRSSYGNALRSMKRNMMMMRKDSTSSSKRSLVVMAAADHHGHHGHDINMMPATSSYSGSTNYCRIRYYGRSNSFYSEAIADCLDFIKRNSLSVDEKTAPPVL